MSSKSAKHRKHKRVPARPTASARHKKPSPVASALANHPTRTAAAVTGAVLIAAAAPAATHWSGSVGVGQAAVIGHAGDRADLGSHASPSASGEPGHAGQADGVATCRGQRPSGSLAETEGRPAPAEARQACGGAAGLRQSAPRDHRPRSRAHRPGRRLQRAGPIYPLGDAVITNAQGDNYGWPGGGWITYRLTDGPAAGLTVYVAENVTPTVTVGQQVTSSTQIATMYEGGDGIETGWAMASGLTAESQLPEAGGISGPGPFPTDVGTNFDELLQALGVPAANNRYDYSYGILPSSYPSDWATALRQ